MKGYHVIDGYMKRTYKPISKACPITIKYASGVSLEIPESCSTRTGQLKVHVAKAVLAKNYKKLEEYGVTVRHVA